MSKKFNLRNKSFFIFLFSVSALFLPRLEAQDSLALVALYNATDGDNWTNNTNWLVPGQALSTWFGINTNAEGEITSLSLFSNNLTGTIPPEIGNLPATLTELNLDFNDLSGGIPTEIGNLSGLESLSLVSNQLSGGIPAEIGNLSNLTTLDLAGNMLLGTIPTEIGNLSNLTRLNLRVNLLTGTIPAEIGNLENLQNLNLSTNDLSGGIPLEIFNLNNLVWLYLTHNDLSGGIPAEIGNLSNLTTLDLRVNLLTGTIPAEIGNLENLQNLDLSSNDLSGGIPAEIGNLENLQNLSFSINELSGGIPAEIGNLSNLTTLNLAANLLTGTIPVEVGNLESLQNLRLSTNDLSGEIPAEIGNLSGLESLSLSNNNLSGELPVELSNLSNLTGIYLSGNQLSGCFPISYEVFCNIDYYFSGNPGLPGGGDFASFCNDLSGACDPSLSGQVKFDENGNCANDMAETGLYGWTIKAVSGSGEYYAYSRINGLYALDLPLGNYDIEVFPPNPLWQENCTGIVNLDIVNADSIYTVDFPGSAVAFCPYLTVDISAPFLRRCFDNVYYLHYCNAGTATAENAFVEITFDSLVGVDSASVAISAQNGNTYTFDLGNLDVNQCGTVNIYTNISCDAEVGQTLCVEAHIFPDSLCAADNANWSGASVQVTGNCTGGDVVFTIENIGDENMLVPSTYIIIEDEVVLMADPETFLLGSSESMDIELAANGSTYVLQAMQVANHPGLSMPSVALEGCGTNANGTFSTGFVTQFPEDDADPFVSIDCQEVVGSWDPNDKRGFPKGYGDEHLIERGQDIEYHIRFQNTGTDTAFTVVVKDAISSDLDFTTFRPGASSHPYIVDILGDTLQFTFDHILLPDSNVNEAASHGFVKFRIGQKPNLPLGTVIENNVAIYFDFNDPVITNTTKHKIGENYFEITAVENPLFPGLEINVSPNPFDRQTIISIKNIFFGNAELSLYNTMGTLVANKIFDGNKLLLSRDGLPSGIYIFKLTVDGALAGTGRLVVQ